jgi:hypothetical protein
LQDVDPWDTEFDMNVEIPDEILCEGWVPVLTYLRELHKQDCSSVPEARVFLLGMGKQGKTSLLRALMTPEHNLTDPIEDNDRTVGIDTQVLTCNALNKKGKI